MHLNLLHVCEYVYAWIYANGGGRQNNCGPLVGGQHFLEPSLRGNV